MSLTLVTGVNGFCGYHLVKRLQDGGSELLAGIDLTSNSRPDIHIDEYFQCNLSQPLVISSLLKQCKPTRIFHFAGMMFGSRVDLLRSNCLGTLNLLNSVKDHAPDCRVLLVGSAAEYGYVNEAQLPVSETQDCKPYSVYGKAKYGSTLIGLKFANKYGLRVVVARPFNIVGAGISTGLVVGAVINRISKSVGEGRKAFLTIPVGDTQTVRDFLAVEDVIEAYIKIIEGEFWGHIFNVCSGQPRTVQSVLDILVSLIPHKCSFQIDQSLLGNSDLPVIYGDPGKARRFLGFSSSYKLEDSLRAAWDYENSNGRESA